MKIRDFYHYTRTVEGPFRVFYWLLGYCGCPSVLMSFSFFNPAIAVTLFLAVIMAFFVGTFQMLAPAFEYSSGKVRNLLLYKMVTKQKFTPAEIQMLDKYFGNTRKQLVRDYDETKTYKKIVQILDVGAVLIFLATLMLLAMFIEPHVPNVEETLELLWR